jgi:hypothetical protein
MPTFAELVTRVTNTWDAETWRLYQLACIDLVDDLGGMPEPLSEKERGRRVRRAEYEDEQ